MITIILEECKSLTQEIYDSLVDNLEIHQLECTCGKCGNLIKHGRYTRSVKVPDDVIPIKVLRVICKSCKKTHAILPSLIVPYSQTQLNDHIDIIKSHHSQASYEPIMENNPNIDENNIRYIIRKFLRYWKERLTSLSLSVFDDTINILTQCLTEYGKQFMQIKSTENKLFCRTHIT